MEMGYETVYLCIILNKYTVFHHLTTFCNPNQVWT